MSQPHDPAEREADRVADAVGRGETVAVGRGGAESAAVHRMCAECEEEQSAPEEETPVHAKRNSSTSQPAMGDAGRLAGLEGSGRPLPADLRTEFEPRFGYDFADVRFHTDAKAAAAAHAFDALAFTYGRHVTFGAGQFDPSSDTGRRLIAHELTHVVQQSGQARPALQRQGKGGPLDLRPDVCITLPGLGELCGQAAADACAKLPSIPGCGIVCKAFDCSKPREPKTICPPGWRAAGSKDFEGQCCKGTTDSANRCCSPARIATFDDRCCGPEEVVVDNRCTKSSDLPPIPHDVFCPSGQRTLLGKCCFPPLVSQGLVCGLPNIKPPLPQPVFPTSLDIFFKLDRPQENETAAGLPSAITGEGKANFDALVARLKPDAGLQVQLIGRASPDGTKEYNLALGSRRARLVAEALAASGVSASQIADSPDADLRSECQSVGAGIVTCGEAGATGPGDREVLARLFRGTP